MDEVKDLLNKLTDKTTTEYTKLKEISDLLDSRKTKDYEQLTDPTLSYTPLIEKIKTKATYDEVKALADGIQVAITAGKAKVPAVQYLQ